MNHEQYVFSLSTWVPIVFASPPLRTRSLSVSGVGQVIKPLTKRVNEYPLARHFLGSVLLLVIN